MKHKSGVPRFFLEDFVNVLQDRYYSTQGEKQNHMPQNPLLESEMLRV